MIPGIVYGNQRGGKAWTFYKYDARDRCIMSGEIVIEGDQLEIVQRIEEFYASAPNESRYEIAGDNNGYSNHSFPVLDESARVDRVTYFDDYSFISTLPSPSSYQFHPELSVSVGEKLERAVGQATGSKLRVLSTESFVYAVTYYDTDCRAIQVVSEDHMEGLNRKTTRYGFNGDVLQSRYTLERLGTSARFANRYTYDHAQRIERVLVKIDDNDSVVLSEFDYNEIGQVVCKKLHSTDDGVNFAEEINYRYNIREWPTAINSAALEPWEGHKLFAMELLYEEEDENVSNVPQFNGNVSAVRWKNAHFKEEQAYVYLYDGFNRLAAARYRSAGPKDGAFDVSGFDGSSIAYDPNGNLRAVSRHAFVSSERMEVDKLEYSYHGNQLTRVRNLSGRSEGFHDAGVEEDAYEYDAKGNMVIDKNKDIDISYNSLNQVNRITRRSGESVQFAFDADGRKIFREERGPDGAPLRRFDYVGDCVFEDGVLRLVKHDQGQIVWYSDEEVWRFRYFLDDHLGNVRVAFEVGPTGCAEETSVGNSIVYVEDYYPFGLRIVNNEFKKENGVLLKHLFGGREVQDVMGLEWYDFGTRMLDPAIGRWFSLDLEAEKNESIAPYVYVFGNPIRYVDFDGRDGSDFTIFGQTFVAPWDPRAEGVLSTLKAYGEAGKVAAAGALSGAATGAGTGAVVGGVSARSLVASVQPLVQQLEQSPEEEPVSSLVSLRPRSRSLQQMR
jgi:RHS repeat-associated protein